METYLELEGKLGPRLQPQSNQPRPAQPITNPYEKGHKGNWEKKEAYPCKYTSKSCENPESNNTNAWPPATVSKAPTDLKNQTPSQEGTLENNPHLLKTSQFALAPHDLKQEKCQGTFLNWEKTGQSLLIIIKCYSYCYYPKSPHKDRAPGQGTTKPQFNGSTEARKVRMGTKLPHLQELRERLGWWPSEAVPTMTTASDTMPPVPKLPEAPEFPEIQVTDIWCTWQVLKLIKTLQTMGRRKWRGSITNMHSITFWTQNSTLNQMKEKNTDMNIIRKHSSKLLKSEPLKHMYFIFFHSYSEVKSDLTKIILLYKRVIWCDLI